MGHPYSRNPDHIRSRHVPAPDNGAIEQHLEQPLCPLIYNQQAYYRRLGLRDRILTLPLMVAAVVTLLWRQVPSREDLLWAKAVKVRQQSLSERFLTFPSALFERIFEDLLPLNCCNKRSLKSKNFRPINKMRPLRYLLSSARLGFWLNFKRDIRFILLVSV